MLLNVKNVKKLETAVSLSAGPALNPLEPLVVDQPSEPAENFDYKVFRFLYNLLEKSTTVTTENLSPEQQIQAFITKADKDLFLEEFYKTKVDENTKNGKFNLLLKKTLKSVEQFIHHSDYLDKSIPKTKQGQRYYFYRKMMRELIERKENNKFLVNYKPEKLLSSVSKETGYEKIIADLTKEAKKGEILETKAMSAMQQAAWKVINDKTQK